MVLDAVAQWCSTSPVRVDVEGRDSTDRGRMQRRHAEDVFGDYVWSHVMIWASL